MPDPEAADPPPKNRRRKLGEMLVDAGILSPDQLEEALRRQKVEKGTRLGRLLVDLGFATETQICEIVADQLRIPAADMVAVDVPEDVLAKLTRGRAQHTCMTWFVEGASVPDHDRHHNVQRPMRWPSTAMRVSPWWAGVRGLAASNGSTAGRSSRARRPRARPPALRGGREGRDLERTTPPPRLPPWPHARRWAAGQNAMPRRDQGRRLDIPWSRSQGRDLRYRWRAAGKVRPCGRVQNKVVSRISLAHLDISEAGPQDGSSSARGSRASTSASPPCHGGRRSRDARARPSAWSHRRNRFARPSGSSGSAGPAAGHDPVRSHGQRQASTLYAGWLTASEETNSSPSGHVGTAGHISQVRWRAHRVSFRPPCARSCPQDPRGDVEKIRD